MVTKQSDAVTYAKELRKQLCRPAVGHLVVGEITLAELEEALETHGDQVRQLAAGMDASETDEDPEFENG